MPRLPVIADVLLLLFAFLSAGERRAEEADSQALSADVEEGSCSSKSGEDPTSAEAATTTAPNSGSAYEIWRTQPEHKGKMSTNVHDILDNMYVLDDNGAYVGIPDHMRADITKTIDSEPGNFRYVIGKETKLVTLPTYGALRQGNALFHGNPEQNFKNKINPYQKDGDTYTFRYTDDLKRMAINKDLEAYLMYPPNVADESTTTNREQLIADPEKVVDFGIKQRGPLCAFFGKYGFLAVPKSVDKEQGIFDYLQKLIKHQRHEEGVEFAPDEYVVLDFHDKSLPNSFLLKDLEWDTEKGKLIPKFDDVYDKKKKEILARAVASYHLEPKDQKNPHSFDQVAAEATMDVPSLLPGLALDTHKYGRGMKFGVYGATACVNAVVTRFDANGHVNFLANIRPENAHGDRGEFQMTAGTIAVAPSEHFGIEKFQSQWPRLTIGQVEDTGKLKDDALNFARAGIFQKAYSGYDWTRCAFNGADGGPLKWEAYLSDCEKTPDGPGCKDFKYCNSSLSENQPRVINQIKRWNFFKIRAGIVDDQAGTNEAWVETAYVWHHIQGNEDEELELFNIASPKPGMPQVGAFVWRNIDQVKEAEKRTTQMAISPENPGAPYQFKEINVEQAYDPYIEYELWHGDHSLGARDIEAAVHAHFEFTGPAPSKGETPTWFGRSKPKHEWMSMLADETPAGEEASAEEEADKETPAEEEPAEPNSSACQCAGIASWLSVASVMFIQMANSAVI